MINIIILIITILIFLLVIAIVGRAILTRQTIFGRPPIPVFFFILAKMMVVINLVFLLSRGLQLNVCSIFKPALITDIVALVFLTTGACILFVSTFQLNRELIFGLSDSGDHRLHTNGLYSISHHPFYLGFIFILFSSCLFNPNLINIIAFLTAWVIHHFIMIKEEEFLESVYGEEYRLYKKRVRRYLNF
jgi:protein-S-isoprenylcysteine O-methyltransferase Ste14